MPVISDCHCVRVSVKLPSHHFPPWTCEAPILTLPCCVPLVCYSNLNKNHFNQERGARTQNQNASEQQRTNEARLLRVQQLFYIMFSQVSTLRTHCWFQREGGVGRGGVSEQALLGLPGVACEQALHLGDIVKSRRARGTPK